MDISISTGGTGDPGGRPDNALANNGLADNPLARFIADWRARRSALEALAWPPPEPPPAPDDEIRNARLKPVRAGDITPPEQSRIYSVDELRLHLPEFIADYLDGADDEPLLLKLPFGVGKTHAAVQVLQERVQDSGLRALWCADRHDAFDNLAGLSNFDNALWYHWQPISGMFDTNTPMCKLAEAQKRWLAKGYSAMDLCLQPCRRDGHLKQCPYRAQEKRKEHLIFAMHHHLASGLAITNFDAVVIDEIPLKAFIKHRHIAKDQIVVGTHGPVGELLTKLAALCETAVRPLSGKPLMDEIGATLTDVYAQLELIESGQLSAEAVLPVVPTIWQAEDVERAPAWFIFDLLNLALAEWRAWRAGATLWAERVKVLSTGLTLIDRAEVWEKLPRKRLILDATGDAQDYELIFGSLPMVHEFVVPRQGKLYQVVGRTNGKSSLVHGDELSEAGREALALAEVIAGDSMDAAIICPKIIAKHAARKFGSERVLHYGDQRGSNRLADSNPLICIGSISPNEQQIIDMATALDKGRIESFWTLNNDGQRVPLYQKRRAIYRLSPAGRALVTEQPPTADDWAHALGGERMIGSYADADLRQLQTLHREQEILQAVHRARLNLREATVWLITAVPLSEDVDGLWQDPFGIEWKHWPPLAEALKYQPGPLTAADLAKRCGVTEDWVRKNRWLDKLVRADVGWQWHDPAEKKRGRQTLAITRRLNGTRQLRESFPALGL